MICDTNLHSRTLFWSWHATIGFAVNFTADWGRFGVIYSSSRHRVDSPFSVPATLALGHEEASLLVMSL